MREEFRRKMREDIDLLRNLADALADLHDWAEVEYDCIKREEEEGLELAPMMTIGEYIRRAREECRAFDEYFVKKYGEEKSDGTKLS